MAKDFTKIIQWVRLFRAVGALEGRSIGLREAKEAWDHTHPNQPLLSSPEKYRLEAERMTAKVRWIKEFRDANQCSLREAINAHRDAFGY